MVGIFFPFLCHRTLGNRLRAVAFLVALILPGCSGVSTTEVDRPNIVLVSIDSLRWDHVGSYGYDRPTTPFLDELAAKGIRFENTFSTTSWTLPSHAAMFTGLYDSTHGLVDNGMRLADEHRTLAEMLRDEGYETVGFFGGPYLHPTFGLAQGFEAFHDCMVDAPALASGTEVRRGLTTMARHPSHSDVTGPRTAQRVSEWLEGRSAKPFFLFLHMWDVHYDYIPPAEYVEMFDADYDGELTGERFFSNPLIHPELPAPDLEHLLALYDGEIRFTDDILRRIFSELESRGLLENTLVVVTSDHGDEFFEHGYQGHGETLFEEVVRIPLIVSWPGRLEGGRVVTELVRLVDLAPTLAAVAGYDDELELEGRNLLPLLEGGSVPAATALTELYSGGAEIRALRTLDAKLLLQDSRSEPLLFRLTEDPHELNPIGPGTEHEEDRRRYARELLEALEAAEVRRAALGLAGSDPVQPNDEMLERLRSLGYIK